MAEWLTLPEVISGTACDARPVAWREGRLVARREFLADVAGWYAAFAAQAGTRWALYFDDGYDFACALYGAWQAGKEVFLPGDAQPGTLERLREQVDGCAGALPGALQPLSGAPVPAWRPLDAARTRLVVFTSGSSGEPAAIPKRLAQLDAEIHTLQAAFGARLDRDGPTAVHATVSHQHIYGLLFYTLWPLAAGRPFVARRLVYPEEMAARLGHNSLLVASPAHLRRLPETLDWRAARAGLQAVFSSGGPLPPEAAQDALARLGHSPIEVYGSSETGGIAWRQRAQHADRWQPLPGIELRFDDEALSVRSPHLAEDGWWTTADRVQALPDGGFVLQGRADRIVKIEEKRVSLSAIERALTECTEIEQARVLLLQGGTGPRVGAVAVPSAAGWSLLAQQGKRELNERLRAALAQGVERVALPRRWRYVRALPVNAQGKTPEALLAALFRPAMPQLRWTQREAQAASVELDIVPELAVFDGHFPDTPILPGVAQLDWAISLGQQAFPVAPRRFLRIEVLKFQRPVQPGTLLRLALQWTGASGTLGFRYESDAGPHASGRIVFGAADAL